jgi:hypothetical protein
MLHPYDYDADDTILERQLRETTVNLRNALHEVITDAERALARLDDGQRPTSSLFPGRAIDASKANGYAGMFDALLNLPWGHESIDGNPDRADEIVRTAGRRS